MTGPEASLKPPRPKAAYWIASVSLAAILLYFSLRGIEWMQVWAIVAGAKIPVVLAGLATMSVALFLRAARWRIILMTAGYVPVSVAFWATAAGYLGNNLLPARAGELVRSLLISSRTGMSKAFVLTTALSERVVDAIALITISSVVLLTLRQKPGWIAQAARPFAILGLCGAAAIALAPALEVFWFRLLTVISLSPKLRERVERALRQILQGIRGFHNGSRLLKFLILTAMIWLTDAITTIVTARSLGLSMTLPIALLLLAGLGLGSALPSTPGYVGIYQFVAVSVLTPFGFNRADAIAYILLAQAINYAVILSLGTVGLWQQRVAAISQRSA